MLEPAPVQVARNANTCRVRQAAIRSASLPASLRQLEQAEAVLSKGDTVRIDVADGEEFSGTHTVNIDGSIALPFIPTGIDQYRCAQSRKPMDMIFQGWSMRLFQA